MIYSEHIEIQWDTYHFNCDSIPGYTWEGLPWALLLFIALSLMIIFCHSIILWPSRPLQLAFSNWTASFWRPPGRWLRQRRAISWDKVRLRVSSMTADSYQFSSWSYDIFWYFLQFLAHSPSPSYSASFVMLLPHAFRGAPYATLIGILAYLKVSLLFRGPPYCAPSCWTQSQNHRSKWDIQEICKEIIGR